MYELLRCYLVLYEITICNWIHCSDIFGLYGLNYHDINANLPAMRCTVWQLHYLQDYNWIRFAVILWKHYSVKRENTSST